MILPLLLAILPLTRAIQRPRSILVAGSLNADTFLPIARFPSPGENLTLLSQCEHLVDIPGGKGMNQAIAACKLRRKGDVDNAVSFMGQFGNDGAADILRNSLVENGVDISLCGQSNHPTGRGYVMLVPNTGEVTAVISGGSNQYGWGQFDADVETALSDQEIEDMIQPYSLVQLQCEVPDFVNLRLARTAKRLGIPVILDVGGEDRKMGRDLVECCDYLIPNESELERLSSYIEDDCVADTEDSAEIKRIQSLLGPDLDAQLIFKRVCSLQRNLGANNVLVTLGSRGSILFRKPGQPNTNVEESNIIYQSACRLPSKSSVVDETGAGDCYRAAFAVSLMEQCTSTVGDVDEDILRKCMKFASAAGALAVTKKGAVPSIPTRDEVKELMRWNDKKEDIELATNIPRGGMKRSGDDGMDNDFPFMFGSRLNSMKDRQDLIDPSDKMLTPRDYVRRQSNIKGLGCVDFNYPQHFHGYWTPEEAKQALDEVGLVAGAVCLRYPSKFARGAMNHPDEHMRREAIDMTKDAAKAARILGCNEVVVWSAYDGYDYPFQVNYKDKWNQLVSAFQECCDEYPDIKWSLEYKPTDENTRYFTVPSTGAAMLFVNEVNRPNMGLTLDVGHMLMSGENPGQSISMAGDKLFGIQLNDGYTRLAAEDGMMFGSIHPSMALEVLYQLRINNFQGHLYFDTFPQRSDPVKEAEYNIRRVLEFWRAVEAMDPDEINKVAMEHDALGALDLVNEALRR